MSTVSTARVVESVPLILLRLALGGLFFWAGAVKASGPQAFAFAIKGYGLIDAETGAHAIRLLAFTIPWAEMLCGVLLVLGAWTRGAGLFLAIQLAGFTLANWAVLDKNINCTCFGDKELFCANPIGVCHMVRNGVMTAVALLLSWRGGGLWSVDGSLSRLRSRAMEGPADEA